jgi:hypothetical protein
MKNALVRAALAALALCVGAWLAVGYRETQLEEKGTDARAAIVRHSLPPNAARDALESLRDAQWLNPDQDPRVTEGELNLFLSHRAKAAAIARELTAKEPDNVRGWFLAYFAENGPAKAEARQQVKRLDPWAGDTLKPSP